MTATIKQADNAAFFDAINNRTYPGMYAITTARANLAPGITILSTQGFTPDQNNEGSVAMRTASLPTASPPRPTRRNRSSSIQK